MQYQSAVSRIDTDEPIRADGRARRSSSTRTAVVDGLLALLEAGDLRPTAPRIAERAGVSLRSVYQHFTDLEALFAAAAGRQSERIRALVAPIAPDAPLAERRRDFAAQRARLLEAITPVRRAALLMEPFSAEIAKSLRHTRGLGRTEVERVFARELDALPAAERRERLAALDVASSWPTWEALRAHQNLSVERARKVMARMLDALLA